MEEDDDLQTFKRIVGERGKELQIEWEDGELEWFLKSELRKWAPDAVEDWENAEEPEPLVVCSERELEEGVRKLATLLEDAKRAGDPIVFHVGAGISTAAGVPDFRGANGLWTTQRQPDALPSLQQVQPTATHRALVTLQQHGYITHLVSQNYDGLLLRAGFPAKDLSEIHGNLFVERCDDCLKEWQRAGGRFGSPESASASSKTA